jgi:hypothetical protein
MKIYILGNGHVNSYSIRVQKVEVEIHGKGYCEVTTLKRLDVNLVGNGNVYYMGMPKIHKRINGKGDVYCSNKFLIELPQNNITSIIESLNNST